MKNITLVVGARPNFVKASSLCAAVARRPALRLRLVHTGQHYDDNMAGVFFRELGVPEPAVNLGVGSGTQSWQIANTILELERELLSNRPDVLMTVGDVNATLAASIVGSKLGISLAHVEAGLRSWDRRMSEEGNRVVADALSDVLFTTSADADENLLKEGIPAHRIVRVGNVMVDTLLRFRSEARTLAVRESLGIADSNYGIVTLHRAETVDDSSVLKGVIEALQEAARELLLIFPVHPRTKARIEASGALPSCANGGNLRLVPPMSYLSFLGLMGGARLVLTDSGGIQAETTILGIPCLTLRDSTEYTITLSHGTNRLAGTTPETILPVFADALKSKFSVDLPPLWDGLASDRIAETLLSLG